MTTTVAEAYGVKGRGTNIFHDHTVKPDRCKPGTTAFRAVVLGICTGLLSTSCIAAAASVTERGEHVTDPMALRLMSFNIEWGGTHVRFDSVAEAIRISGAEIVGVQEAEGNLARLAAELGWYYDLRSYVISRYPVIAPEAAGGKYALVEVRRGEVVALANVHLPSTPSGAAWLRAGRTPEQVVAMERRVRLVVMQPFIAPLPALAAKGLPVFLSGDFNAPSHEDWTEATIGRFPHRDHTVAWPVTQAVAAAGLRDAFRDIHSDPIAHPGFTWWAARPRIRDYNPTDTTRRSRIDFLWYGGSDRVLDSHLVGEADAAEVAVSVTPWPSDHRAVVADFEVTPAPMPVLIAAEHEVHTSGNPFRFFWRNTSPRGTLVLERRAAKPITERRIAVEGEFGHLQLPDRFLVPGEYEVALHDSQGVEVSRDAFWIVAPDAEPLVAVPKHRFTSGEAVPVAWENGPGHRYDWIGIFEAGHAESRDYRAWAYVGARSSGALTLTQSNAEGGWPLPPGTYVARFLLDDGFTLLAESEPFTVE